MEHTAAAAAAAAGANVLYMKNTGCPLFMFVWGGVIEIIFFGPGCVGVGGGGGGCVGGWCVCVCVSVCVCVCVCVLHQI